MTWDVRELTPYVPLLLTAGFGATLDSTGGLVSNQVLNASEEFALNTNQYQRLNVMASAEIPFPVVTPFVEWQIAPVLGVPGGELVGPDGIYVSAAEAIRHTIGAGIKLTPIKDLTLLSGFNFGLARRVGLGIPATPPWNFFVGASFAIDPFQHGEKKLVVEVREKETEVVKAPPALRLEGVITDAETKAPLPGVIVAIAGNKPTASGSDGAYESLPVTGDKVTVSVSREGYKSIEQEFAVDADGPTKVDLELVPDVKKAEFLVSTTSKSKPVKAAISFQGAEEARGETGEGDGKASFELVAGVYTVTAIADGYLAKTRDVQVSPGGTLNLDFELEAVPKKVLVIFKGDKIEILQQVHFATGKATILPDSHGLLAQVVDAIIKNDVKRVRVDGHTDNKGKKDFNQQLSEDRAQAVKDYLIKQGLDANRLEAAGYGDSKPVAPNLTARGRELNRRVEFIVLER